LASKSHALVYSCSLLICKFHAALIPQHIPKILREKYPLGGAERIDTDRL